MQNEEWILFLVYMKFFTTILCAPSHQVLDTSTSPSNKWNTQQITKISCILEWKVGKRIGVARAQQQVLSHYSHNLQKVQLFLLYFFVWTLSDITQTILLLFFVYCSFPWNQIDYPIFMTIIRLWKLLLNRISLPLFQILCTFIAE